MTEREQKALIIAAKSKLVKKGDVWRVPSQSGYKPYYEVDPNPESPRCTCPDFETRRERCKHIFAVEYTIEREQSITQTTDGDTTTTTVTESVKITKRVTYKQDWTAYNTAQTNEKHLFESLLNNLCGLVVGPPQERGRPLMTGVKTHIVTSVEITGRHDNDSPQFPPLVNKTAKGFIINECSAKKAYSGFDNHEAIAKVGGTPYIAFKSNATGAIGGVFQKMFYFYRYKRDEFLAHYHKRSNSESTFSMVKAKFGGHLRSKSDTGQTNEALCKVLCHNLCALIQSIFEFGIEPNFLIS
jgi:hypothetical protein